VASLVTMAGALGVLALSGATPAGAIGGDFAYPQGGATSPSSCPQTTTVADQCTLSQALSVAAFADTVELAVSGVEGNSSTHYVGNFTVMTPDVTIAPAPGVSDPIIDGNGGSSTGCPTTSCSGPVLSVAGVFVTVTGVTIEHGNNEGGNGGGIDNNGQLMLTSTTFLDNTAFGSGGAVDNEPGGTLGFLTSDTFTGNSAGGGGAIANVGQTTNTTIAVSDSTFTNNAAQVGGAIENGHGLGSLSVNSSSFVGNSAVDGGGAILNGYLDNGPNSLTVTSSTFLHDSSTGTNIQSAGGAIDNGELDPLGATATVTDSTFTSDSAFAGGAIASGTGAPTGSLTVTGSTFADDSATDGGAIDSSDNFGETSANVSASTFSGDHASGNGGAIDVGDNSGLGEFVLSQSTLAANSASGTGGAIASLGNGNVFLLADILAKSPAGGECGGAPASFQDFGRDVDDDGTCGLLGARASVSDSPAIDAYLGSLDNYGGPTETIPLEASPTLPVGPDPALDAIPQSYVLTNSQPACSTPDQRGVARTAPCDIGAFEVHPTNVATETTLVGSASSTTAGTSVTYTATVLPTTDDEPGSAVTFIQDGSPATCTGSTFDGQTATCTIAYPTPGVHAVRAIYGGDTVFAASAPSAPWTTTVTALPPTPTSTALDASATGVAPGQSLTLTATVSPAQSGSSPGTVAFDDDGQPLNCGAGSTAFDGTTATCVISFPFAFEHQVTAVYSGDATATGSTSSTLLITVAFANPGYRIAAADGGVFAFGTPYDGSMGGQHLDAAIVGMATDTVTGGYWLVASDGGVFSFNAPFYGSMGGQHLNSPVVGMAATPSGDGYWLVAADGGIFAFGSGAGFHGSMGGQHLNASVVGMSADGATGGYWLVASDGGVFSFNAPFEGSTGGLSLNAPISGMAATGDGGGYWLVGSDGGVFNYGDATFHGANGGEALASPIVGIAPDIYTGGYWLVAANGATESYGAPGDGMFPDLSSASPAVAIAAG
jgi:hypothetical protein